MNYFTPAQIVQNYADAGAVKTKKPAGALLMLGILAGIMIGIAAAASNTAVYGYSETWIAKTVAGMIFPFGLGMVVIMGAELFTGNCLIGISVVSGQATVAGMLRNWALVYAGNFIGAALTAAACVAFGQLGYSDGLLAVYTIKVGAMKSGLSFVNAFGLGIFCNIFVAMGVLMGMSAKETPGRIMAIFLPVSFFVICGFEHCVANMYYITAAILANHVPAYAALVQQAGVDTSALGLMGLVRNLIPSTLGNIVGGGGLGILLYYCHIGKRGIQDDRARSHTSNSDTGVGGVQARS